MTNGVVLFAHNSRDVDYSLLALISGGLAKKYLKVPVSVITDQATVDWMGKSEILNLAQDVFDQIIIVERPQTANSRLLHDGYDKKNIPFINENRSSIFNLTPYDKTLMLDSDYLVFSDRLSQFWNTDAEVMIAETMKDATGQDIGFLDKFVSETGPHMFWATAVMFTKSTESKIFFDLIDHIKENYKHYSNIYRFNSQTFRNDIAFSIAKHIYDGFDTDITNSLPPILTVIDKNRLEKVNEDGNLIFSIQDIVSPENCLSLSIKNQDIHIMNKQSIIRNKDSLLKLI